jgi:hypothetical protein
MSTFYKLVLAITVLGSLFLLISSLRREGKRAGTREQRMALAGALVLLWVACRFYWHSYDIYTHSYWGLLRPSSVAITFSFGWRLLAGATVALFILAIFPKGAKAVVGLSGALFLGSNLFAISNRAAFVGNAWSIGMAISAVLVWLSARIEKPTSQNGM